MPSADRVRELVDQVEAEAPPLSDEQADRIAGLLSGGRDDSGEPEQLRPAGKVLAFAASLVGVGAAFSWLGELASGNLLPLPA